MRNSPIARKSLSSIITAAGNPLDVKKLKLKHEYANINALILEAYFMGIGLKLNYVLDKPTNEPRINIIEEFDILGERIMDYRYTREDYYTILSMRNKYMGEHIIPETYVGEAKDTAMKWVLEQPEVKEMEIYDRVAFAFTDRYKNGCSIKIEDIIELESDDNDSNEDEINEDEE